MGIFDSGLGGLTVAAAVRKRLPAERIVYLGDTARVPYGNRSPETITRFALQDAEHLAGHGVKAVVAACNTVSATALGALRTHFPDLPVLGVIEPGADAAAETGARRIAVLGTRATIRSGAYARALLARDPSLRIETRACPLFVPLAEEGVLDGALAEAAEPAKAEAAEGGYNVLFITVDQEHYFSEYPAGTSFKARQLLAELGTTFEKHDACSNMSTSSRSVMFTGTHIPDTGMIDNTDVPWQDAMDDTLRTIGDRLREKILKQFGGMGFQLTNEQ